METSVSSRVRDIVVRQLGVEPADVASDASMLDDLGADSLDVVELVMAIEEAFDIEVDDADVEVMRTIGDVETYVARRVEARA